VARVAVLGGGGFIGANLVRRLVEDGHEVTATDIDFPSFRWPALDSAFTRKYDLTDPRQCDAALWDADWVFHLAADMGGVGYFHSNADLGASLRNGRITANVVESVTHNETPRVFYASSACCYPVEIQGRTPASGFTAIRLHEDLVGRGTPDALYGAEKLHGLRLFSKVPDARVGILHTVYGPLQEHEGRRMKFPAAVATKALAARETGTLELWGDGQQLRSYLYVDDAVEKIMRVMEADSYIGPVNIGAAGAISCRAVAELCLELVGAKGVEIVTNPAEPSGVLARDCDNAYFDARYGKVEETGYREGFAKFIEWLDSPQSPRPARGLTAGPGGT
jgi:GDP-D-mannose 3',5'-epimerase